MLRRRIIHKGTVKLQSLSKQNQNLSTDCNKTWKYALKPRDYLVASYENLSGNDQNLFDNTEGRQDDTETCWERWSWRRRGWSAAFLSWRPCAAVEGTRTRAPTTVWRTPPRTRPDWTRCCCAFSSTRRGPTGCTIPRSVSIDADTSSRGKNSAPKQTTVRHQHHRAAHKDSPRRIHNKSH